MDIKNVQREDNMEMHGRIGFFEDNRQIYNHLEFQFYYVITVFII